MAARLTSVFVSSLRAPWTTAVRISFDLVANTSGFYVNRSVMLLNSTL